MFDTIGSVPHVTTVHPPAQAILGATIPAQGRILFYAGLTASPWGHGSIVVDTSGTVRAFDHRFVPHTLAIALGTRRPVSAAATGDGGLWIADAEGGVLRFDAEGRLSATGRSTFSAPRLAADPDGDGLWAIRSPEGMRMHIVDGHSPLIESFGAKAEPRPALGTALIPAHGLLVDLANAGSLAWHHGVLFFAPFIRDEVVALALSGDTLWVAHRGLPQARGEPRFEVAGGRATIDYHPVNLGIATGPDGLLYVLSTPGFSTTTGRLDVLDPATGALIRSADLPTAVPTVAVDQRGRIALLEPRTLLTGSSVAQRPLAPPLDLPLLAGGRFQLEGERGKVVLLNTWASWCGPCRREMPALAALAGRFDSADFTFAAVNEDKELDDAREFLRSRQLALAVPVGGGRLQSVLHYPGLPYTILLDRNGRVIRTWIGEMTADRLDHLATVISGELAAEAVSSAPGGHRVHHGAPGVPGHGRPE